ncbi:MAG: transcriptional regulator [Clostridia bacterium]|nr:transcriptional regulator [Clostridia bacterium]
MPKSENQKLKLLYILQILNVHSDENHPITTNEIIERLAKQDITAERKSIYDDIRALQRFGIEVESVKGKSSGYYISGRMFELPELKLLVDVVQSSKFITAKKSLELIKKLEGLTGKHEASQLQRQVFVHNRIKTMNESIYYNVDFIHDAISENKKISFKYFDWDFKGERKYRKNGEKYTVSPWALTWDDENYYMIAYDSEKGMIKHYRVDKMVSAEVTDELREGKEFFESFDMALYSNKFFGMFGGEEISAVLKCDKSLIGIIIDRFGKETMTIEYDDYFTVTVNVCQSPLLISWIMGFGDRIEVLKPQSLRDAVRDTAHKVAAVYE